MDSLPVEYIVKFGVGFLVSALISYVVISSNKNLLSIRFLNIYYTLQFLFIIFFLLSLPESRGICRQGHQYYLRDSVNLLIPVYILFQIGTLLGASIIKIIAPGSQKLPDLVSILHLKPKMIELASIFFALMFFAYPYVKIGSGIGYAIAIIFNYAQFMPFIGGATFKWNKFSSILWVISLGNLFFLGMISGSRGTALLGLACFAIGFFFSLRSPFQKKLYLSLLIVIALPLTTVISLVGHLRHTVGRVSFDKIDAEYIKKAFKVYQIAQRKNIFQSKKIEKELSEQGVGRYVNLVNMTTLLTVPAHYPHIGFEDMDLDLSYVFDLAFISGTKPQDLVDRKVLNYRLNNFGYWLNTDYSVEYSIVTDAWIRFAWAGIFFYAFTYSFFVSIIEIAIRTFWRRIPTFVVISTLCLCLSAFYSYAYTIWLNVRLVVLGVAYAIIICLVIYFLFNLVFKDNIKYKFL